MAGCNANMLDIEIIDAYLKGQATRCFDLLYKRYAGKIYAKCLSMLGDTAQAKDAAQEVFMKIFLNLARFNAKSKFSTWVYSITYNYCIDYIRRHKKQQAVFSDDLERAPDLVEDEISDKVLLELEYEQLNDVLQQLQASDRAILLMKYQDGESIKDIAAHFGKTESAIKMQIKRAKERARKLRETSTG
ncbi:MAG: sigma-70 family RNA polymerase sigma factor [Bacteroidetes bacterium]|nr:MAG: sigma-70 family RNA polymerase sigma factor [Bacteroidota bacterium]